PAWGQWALWAKNQNGPAQSCRSVLRGLHVPPRLRVVDGLALRRASPPGESASEGEHAHAAKQHGELRALAVVGRALAGVRQLGDAVVIAVTTVAVIAAVVVRRGRGRSGRRRRGAGRLLGRGGRAGRLLGRVRRLGRIHRRGDRSLGRVRRLGRLLGRSRGVRAATTVLVLNAVVTLVLQLLDQALQLG